jgi:hypothetical protein
MNNIRNEIELACEYAINPLGVDTLRPRFGWLHEFDRFYSGWVLLETKGKAGAKITIHHESTPAGWETEGQKEIYTLKGKTGTTIVAVNYAWANNPAAPLYNSGGIPAVPFNTEAQQ